MPGADILEALRTTLALARERSAALRTEGQTLDGQMNRLATARAETFLQLARLYLPALTRQKVSEAFDEARVELEQVIGRKERTQQDLAGRLGRLQEELQQTSSDLRDVTHRLDEVVRRRESLEQALSTRLQEHQEFQALSRQAVDSEGELRKNELRVEELERDARDKLPAYERSRLFQYLHDRRFGTSEYSAGAWTRRMDHRVARLIDFERARRSHEFLTKTPPLMRAEVERRRAEFDGLMHQVEQFEFEAATAIGLTDVLKQGEELGRRRDEQVARQADVQQRVAHTEHELAELDNDQGRFYAEALQRFQNFLMKADTARLERRASETPDRVDDELVSRLRWLGDEIDRLGKQIPELVTRTKAADQVQDGLDHVVRRFQQHNFDSQRSHFSSDREIRQTLAQFETGAVSRDALWTAIRDKQAFDPTWAENHARDLVSHPLTGVLLHAMVEVAGAALQQSATRSVGRRSISSSGHSSSGRVASSHSSPSSVSGNSSPSASYGGSSDGGFTSGEGF